VKVRATGPGPLRTARGAGRLPLAVERLEVARLVVGLLVLRDRVLELGLRLVLLDRVLPLRLALDEDVLLLRDPGGEDVRVAMLRL